MKELKNRSFVIVDVKSLKDKKKKSQVYGNNTKKEKLNTESSLDGGGDY